jgi:hypothetical protein
MKQSEGRRRSEEQTTTARTSERGHKQQHRQPADLPKQRLKGGATPQALSSFDQNNASSKGATPQAPSSFNQHGQGFHPESIPERREQGEE